MRDNSDDVGRWAFIGLCVGAIIVLAANGMQCLPDKCGPFWGGGRGYAEILTSIGTLVAAVVAGWLAWRSYRMNLRGALAARFQKGVELLGQDPYTSNVGGVTLLVSAMREDPETYIAPSTKVLLAFGVERADPFMDGSAAGIWTVWSDSSIEGLLGCASVPFERRWPDAIEIAGTLRVHNICGRDQSIFGIDFRRMTLTRCAWERMRFVDCNLQNVEMTAAAYGHLIFEGCDLRGTHLLILEGRRPDDVHFPVELRHCLVDEDTLVNGVNPPTD